MAPHSVMCNRFRSRDFQRMRGARSSTRWAGDDNGLATERRVQKLLRRALCDPPSAVRPETFAAPDSPPKTRFRSHAKLSRVVRAPLLRGREGIRSPVAPIGALVDWTLTYTTSEPRHARTSQRAFLRNLARGRHIRPTRRPCGTSISAPRVAQAELEDSGRSRVPYHAAALFIGRRRGVTY